MTTIGWLQIVLFVALILALTRPVGGYLVAVFDNGPHPLQRAFGPIEGLIYRAAGIDPRREQHWFAYAVAMLLFNGLGILVLYALLRLQGLVPLNPQGFAGVTADLAFNTAVSFVTNTNWQSYAGETTMSHFSQMAGLTVQNFLSAATGIALSVVFIRAFSRRSASAVGNFWVDLTRCTLFVLLPIAFAAAIFFVWQGVPQSFSANVQAATLEGASQSIAQGPVASQLAIKLLGTNGGGFFNANSAHPYENPTALSNMVQIVLIFLIGAGLTNAFGRMVGDERQGWALLSAMGVLFVAGVGILYWAEAAGNPAVAVLGVDAVPSALQPGGNMERKEVRFGLAMSSLFATVTTDASCGAVNAMHDSFMPLGGFVALTNMLLGEVIVGGVGAGLYGILLFAILAVFVAGLMVGRTPEYLGKKIESREVKLTMLALLCLPLAVLGLLAVAMVVPAGLAGLQDGGPHGFSEAFYAFTSAAANNGSAFAGLSANTPFYNILLGVGMLIGRFAVIVPMLAVAGSLAAKPSLPPSPGTFPTHGLLFVGLLVAVILILGGLTYFPALALGPIAEHMAMLAGQLF